MLSYVYLEYKCNRVCKHTQGAANKRQCFQGEIGKNIRTFLWKNVPYLELCNTFSLRGRSYVKLHTEAEVMFSRRIKSIDTDQ